MGGREGYVDLLIRGAGVLWRSESLERFGTVGLPPRRKIFKCEPCSVEIFWRDHSEDSILIKTRP